MRRLFFYFDGGWWEEGGGWWVVDGVPLFGSLNLLIIIWYIVKVYIYTYTKVIRAEQKLYGF